MALLLHHQLSGNRNKPVILFLHGFMGSGEDWQKVTAGLKDEFACLTVDLPGHGRTTPFPDKTFYTMPGAAALVINVLESEGLQRCFLVGYSMGGRLALYLSLYYPQYFEKVLIESASPGLPTYWQRLKRRLRDRRLADELNGVAFSDFLTRWYQQPLFRSLRESDQFSEIFARRLNNRPEELARSLTYMGTGKQPSLWKHLPRIRMPLLILVGERDAKYRDIAARMEVAGAGLRTKIVSGCGHNIHLENPDKFILQLRDFFQSAQKGPGK